MKVTEDFPSLVRFGSSITRGDGLVRDEEEGKQKNPDEKRPDFVFHLAGTRISRSKLTRA
jgi:hypothetical protein